MGLASLPFMYLLFEKIMEELVSLKRNGVQERKLWSLRISEPNLGGQWKEILGCQLPYRHGKQLIQLELEVRKDICINKEGRCLF